jgi:DNA-binding LacI/PurR family transcriptional regulator
MGYAPNAIARGLVTQRTHAIGLIVTTIEDPFIAEVVRGIEEIAANFNYRVFLGSSHNDPTREVNLVKALREWRVDGVIVASSRVGALYQPLLKEIGAPIVLINNQKQTKRNANPKAESDLIHSVVIDDMQSSELATRYLISRDIALSAISPDRPIMQPIAVARPVISARWRKPGLRATKVWFSQARAARTVGSRYLDFSRRCRR